MQFFGNVITTKTFLFNLFLCRNVALQGIPSSKNIYQLHNTFVSRTKSILSSFLKGKLCCNDKNYFKNNCFPREKWFPNCVCEIKLFSQSLLTVASEHGKMWGGIWWGSMQGSWTDNDGSLFALITLSCVSADGWKHKGASVTLFKV